MGNTFTIMRWEWFKLQRRRMTWILLAILLGFTQIGVWGAYISYSQAMASGGRVMVPFRTANMPRSIRCEDLRTNPASILPEGTPPQTAAALLSQCRQMLEARYQALLPSRATTTALGITATLGMVLLAVLGASTVGLEYGLGTLRPILARGTGRLHFLAGKYLSMAGATTGALLLVCAAAAGSGALAFHGAVALPDSTAVGLSFGEVAATFVRTWAALLAFMTIAASLTLLTRSTAAGMAVSIGYFVFEGIFVRLMSTAFDWFETVGDYLPMRNLNALARSSFNVAPGGVPGNNSSLGTSHAAIMVALYAIAFAALAITVFRRRDVTGASGG
jgi:ABC-2 type transport system permease protein